MRITARLSCLNLMHVTSSAFLLRPWSSYNPMFLNQCVTTYASVAFRTGVEHFIFLRFSVSCDFFRQTAGTKHDRDRAGIVRKSSSDRAVIVQSPRPKYRAEVAWRWYVECRPENWLATSNLQEPSHRQHLICVIIYI